MELCNRLSNHKMHFALPDLFFLNHFQCHWKLSWYAKCVSKHFAVLNHLKSRDKKEKNKKNSQISLQSSNSVKYMPYGTTVYSDMTYPDVIRTEAVKKSTIYLIVCGELLRYQVCCHGKISLFDSAAPETKVRLIIVQCLHIWWSFYDHQLQFPSLISD